MRGWPLVYKEDLGNIPNIQKVSYSAVPSLSVADFKLHNRIDTTTEDNLITSYIKAATDLIEGITGRAIGTTNFLQTFRYFDCREILLMRSKATAIVSIQYLDETNTLQTFNHAANGVTLSVKEPTKLKIADPYDWPSTNLDEDAVRITFTAGYAADGDIPESLKQAVRFLAAHFYENRTPISAITLSTVPITLQTVINKHRLLFSHR